GHAGGGVRRVRPVRRGGRVGDKGAGAGAAGDPFGGGGPPGAVPCGQAVPAAAAGAAEAGRQGQAVRPPEEAPLKRGPTCPRWRSSRSITSRSSSPTWTAAAASTAGCWG